MKGTEVGSHTLVGVYGDPPHDFGNCFTIKCDDGKWRNVVNFVYENLEALQEQGLALPVEVEALDERTAVLMEPSIEERWYRQTFCEVCCPQSLLPVTQRQRHKRDIARGRREEGNGFITIHMDKPPLAFP